MVGRWAGLCRSMPATRPRSSSEYRGEMGGTAPASTCGEGGRGHPRPGWTRRRGSWRGQTGRCSLAGGCLAAQDGGSLQRQDRGGARQAAGGCPALGGLRVRPRQGGRGTHLLLHLGIAAAQEQRAQGAELVQDAAQRPHVCGAGARGAVVVGGSRAVPKSFMSRRLISKGCQRQARQATHAPCAETPPLQGFRQPAPAAHLRSRSKAGASTSQGACSGGFQSAAARSTRLSQHRHMQSQPQLPGGPAPEAHTAPHTGRAHTSHPLPATAGTSSCPRATTTIHTQPPAASPAHHGAGKHAVQQLADAQIRQLHHPPLSQQQVAGLQVPARAGRRAAGCDACMRGWMRRRKRGRLAGAAGTCRAKACGAPFLCSPVAAGPPASDGSLPSPPPHGMVCHAHLCSTWLWCRYCRPSATCRKAAITWSWLKCTPVAARFLRRQRAGVGVGRWAQAGMPTRAGQARSRACGPAGALTASTHTQPHSRVVSAPCC